MKKSLIYLLFIIQLIGCGSDSKVPETATVVKEDVTAVTKTAASDSSNNFQASDAVSSATAILDKASLSGTIIITPQNHATISLPMSCIVQNISLISGAYVSKGAVIATVINPEFITLQQQYLDCNAQSEYLEAEYNRQKNLAQEQVASQKRLQQSKAEYLSVKSRQDASAAQLALLGVSAESILASGIRPILEVRAPIGGYLAQMNINPGKHVAAGEAMCEVLNKAGMMLKLVAYEKDIRYIKTGSQFKFQINGNSDKMYTARTVSIGQLIDKVTRSLEIYATILDADDELRSGMFVTAKIE